MHYLILIHAEDAAVPDLPREEVEALMEAVDKFDQEISSSGQNVGSIRLQPATTATTLRLRDGKPIKTDGPFAETKEQLGGIYIIEAADQDEAVAIAGRLPMTNYGSLEIRPVLGVDIRRVVAAHYGDKTGS